MTVCYKKLIYKNFVTSKIRMRFGKKVKLNTNSAKYSSIFCYYGCRRENTCFIDHFVSPRKFGLLLNSYPWEIQHFDFHHFSAQFDEKCFRANLFGKNLWIYCKQALSSLREK